jgi:hypothetical protein
VNKMGSAPSGKLGLMLNEIIGTLAFDLTLDLSENPDTMLTVKNSLKRSKTCRNW